MKTIDLFYILSICCYINCTEEGWQVYSIEYVDKENWKQNFNYQNKDSEKYLFGIKELNVLVEKIQNVCVMIKTINKNALDYTLDKEIYDIIGKIKENSNKCNNHQEHAVIFEGFDLTIGLINQFLILFKKKQDEKHETPLHKSIKNVVSKLQDLNALSKVVEKLFNKEKRVSTASYYSYRVRGEFDDLHVYIKNICSLYEIWLKLSYKKPYFFNDKKKELIYYILCCSNFFKNKAHSTNKTILENARNRHKHNNIFFHEYHSHFFDMIRYLRSIMSTLDKICSCKKNIYKYLELLKRSLKK